MALVGANRNDHLLLKGTLDSIPIERPQPSKTSAQGICLDRAYDNVGSREIVAAAADVRREPVGADEFA